MHQQHGFFLVQGGSIPLVHVFPPYLPAEATPSLEKGGPLHALLELRDSPTSKVFMKNFRLTLPRLIGQ